MVLTSQIQRRLTLLFIVLSVALWVAKLSLYEEPADGCSSSEISSGKLDGKLIPTRRNGVDQTKGGGYRSRSPAT